MVLRIEYYDTREPKESRRLKRTDMEVEFYNFTLKPTEGKYRLGAMMFIVTDCDDIDIFLYTRAHSNQEDVQREGQRKVHPDCLQASASLIQE